MTNEVLSAIFSRRSTKKYDSQGISGEELDTILEAGLWAANGKAAQSPLSVAVTDKATRDELSKMNRIINKVSGHNANDVLLIIDATTGQNGVLQAKAFFDAVSVTGIVLTKMDSTSKGGIILAIKDELNIPVKFVCFGEQLDDIAEFDLDNYLYGLTKGMEE